MDVFAPDKVISGVLQQLTAITVAGLYACKLSADQGFAAGPISKDESTGALTRRNNSQT